MIVKVEIENFQSHKKSVLNFTSGTNVIIGQSDTGKSAIFRAINWVCSNRPLGDSFRSEWGGDTIVRLFTSEGNVVERVKTNSKNAYIINGQILEAFGTEVPEEVQNILQMDFANIQAQMDTPFLLSSTPGEAAKLLNKAASIDDIDSTVTNLKRSYSRIDSSIRRNETQLEEYREDIKQYSNIPILEKKIEKLKGSYSIYEGQQERNSRICGIVTDIEKVQKLLDETKNIDDGFSILKTLDKKYKDTNTKKEQTKLMKNLVFEIIERQEKIEKLKDTDNQISTINSLEKSIKTFEEEKEKIAKMKGIAIKISKANLRIDRVKNIIESLEKQFKNLAPETCPLCGNLMNSKN